MDSVRVIEQASQWVSEILQAEVGDERVTWELGLNAFPDPSSSPAHPIGDSEDSSDVVEAFVPVLSLYLEIPGPADQSIYGVSSIAPFGLVKETIELAVKGSLENLREMRDALLTTPSA